MSKVLLAAESQAVLLQILCVHWVLLSSPTPSSFPSPLHIYFHGNNSKAFCRLQTTFSTQAGIVRAQCVRTARNELRGRRWLVTGGAQGPGEDKQPSNDLIILYWSKVSISDWSRYRFGWNVSESGKWCCITGKLDGLLSDGLWVFQGVWWCLSCILNCLRIDLHPLSFGYICPWGCLQPWWPASYWIQAGYDTHGCFPLYSVSLTGLIPQCKDRKE